VAIMAVLEVLNASISDVLIRFVGAHRAKSELQEVRRIASTTFWFTLLLGMVITAGFLLSIRGLALLFATPAMRRLAVPIITIMGASLLFQFSSTVLWAYLAAIEDFHLGAAVDCLYQIVRVGATVVIAERGGSVMLIAAVFPATALLRLIALQVAAHYSTIPFFPHLRDVHFPLLRKMGSFSGLAFIEDNVRKVFAQSDMFVGARFLPVADVALLSVARRFPNGISSLPAQALLVAYPRLISAHEQGEVGSLRTFTAVSARNILALLIPVAAAIWIWVDVLLRTWVGPEVLEAAPILRVLLLYGVFRALYESPLTLAYGVANVRIGAATAIGMLVAAVSIGAFVTWHTGLVGLAVTYAAVQFAGTTVLLIQAFRATSTTLGSWLRRVVVPLILPSASCILWLALCRRILPQTFLSLSLCSLAGFALFATLFVATITGHRRRPLHSDLRLLLVGSE
jgi:O-antigen/teichoic acid export membrane protein